MTKVKKNVLHYQAPGLPEYTLPAGSEGGYLRHCPDPNCPAHERFFAPYWRLNEHMKTDHGWPRKNLQNTLDRRKNGRMKHHKTKEDPTNPSPLPSGPEPVSELDDLPSKSREYRLAHPKKRRHSTAAGTPSVDEEDQSDSQAGRPTEYRPLKKRRSNPPEPVSMVKSPEFTTPPPAQPQPSQGSGVRSEQAFINTFSNSMQRRPTSNTPGSPLSDVRTVSSRHTSTRPSSNPPSNSVYQSYDLPVMDSSPRIAEPPVKEIKAIKPIVEPDQAMRGIVVDFVQQIAPSGSPSTHELPQVLRQMKDLLDTDMIRVNCVMTKKEAEDILSLYNKVSEHVKLKNGLHNGQSVPPPEGIQFTGPTSLPPLHIFKAAKSVQTQPQTQSQLPGQAAASPQGLLPTSTKPGSQVNGPGTAHYNTFPTRPGSDHPESASVDPASEGFGKIKLNLGKSPSA